MSLKSVATIIYYTGIDIMGFKGLNIFYQNKTHDHDL